MAGRDRDSQHSSVQKTRNPKGPHGQRIPTELPVEANRIRHATGVSIVAPKNWDLVHELDSPFFAIAPRGMPGRRLLSILSIELYPHQPQLTEFSKIQFQGQPAFEKATIVRHDTLDDPAWSRYELYLKRDGQWWQITFGTADELKELPPIMRSYLETIQFP